MVSLVIGSVRVGPRTSDVGSFRLVYRDAGPETRAAEVHEPDSPSGDDFYPLSHADLRRMNRQDELAQVRIIVLSFYSDGLLQCACCCEPNTGFLTLDHVNRDGRADREHGGSDEVYRRLYDEIRTGAPKSSRYRALCMNCNWGSRYDGICPHSISRLIATGGNTLPWPNMPVRSTAGTMRADCPSTDWLIKHSLRRKHAPRGPRWPVRVYKG